MPETNTALDQPNLLDVPADFSPLLAAQGEYTADRLREQRPDDYQLVVTLLGRGHGPQFIEDYFHKLEKRMSKNTVKAVRRAEGETIDRVKTRLAEHNFEFAEQADEAASIILGEIMNSSARRGVLTLRDVQSLKIAAGIAVQNGQLLTGKPTANVSVEVFSTPTEDLNAQIAAHIATLKSATTHSLVEKNRTKDGLPTPLPGVTEIEARAEEQSDAAAAQPTESQT